MSPTLNVLVVDDNRSAADALARALRKYGDRAEVAYDGGEAIARLEADRFDVVLTDLRMEPVGGLEVLRAAREQSPPVDTIVFTAYGDVNVAVEAMRLGAADFLTKPVSMEQINQRLSPMRGVAVAPPPLPSPAPWTGRSPATRALEASLVRVAVTGAPVWLSGEVGTGRRFCAKAIHRIASAGAPFTAIDLARTPEWPSSGTALLANVDALSEPLQRRLLQLLGALPTGLRLISTSGPDAKQAVSEGRLLADLYYALCVVEVVIPPLRERAEDIEGLFEHALRDAAARYHRPVPELSEPARQALRAYAWPGNARELINLAERWVALGELDIAAQLGGAPAAGLPRLEVGFNLANYLDNVERRILEEALRLAEGDRNVAGRLLGVERNALRYKLNKYGLLER